MGGVLVIREPQFTPEISQTTLGIIVFRTSKERVCLEWSITSSLIRTYALSGIESEQLLNKILRRLSDKAEVENTQTFAVGGNPSGIV